MLITVGALNLLYQFWVHTRHVPKLGWLEWIFITPSNHRVHHAQNPLYMDRNYGGVFIIWDRLLGTFQEELDEEPVVFGVTTPLASWNPLWANLHFYRQLWDDAVRAGSWRDKLRIWFMPTGWRPQDVAERYPLRKPDLRDFVKYDVALVASQKWYALLQFALYVLGTTGLLVAAAEHGLRDTLIGWCWVALGLYSLGVWLENRPLGCLAGRPAPAAECAGAVADAAGRSGSAGRGILAMAAGLQPGQCHPVAALPAAAQLGAVA